MSVKDFYDKQLDITQDLVGGDIDITTKMSVSGNNGYHMRVTGVMIAKNASADTVEALDCELRGGGRVVYWLKINEVYPLAVEKIYKATSTTEKLVLLGVIL